MDQNTTKLVVTRDHRSISAFPTPISESAGQTRGLLRNQTTQGTPSAVTIISVLVGMGAERPVTESPDHLCSSGAIWRRIEVQYL